MSLFVEAVQPNELDNNCQKCFKRKFGAVKMSSNVVVHFAKRKRKNFANRVTQFEWRIFYLEYVVGYEEELDYWCHERAGYRGRVWLYTASIQYPTKVTRDWKWERKLSFLFGLTCLLFSDARLDPDCNYSWHTLKFFSFILEWIVFVRKFGFGHAAVCAGR